MSMRLQITQESWKKLRTKLVKLQEPEPSKKSISKSAISSAVRIKPLSGAPQVLPRVIIDWPICLNFDESFSAEMICDIIESMTKNLTDIVGLNNFDYILYLAPKNYPEFMQWCRENINFLNLPIVKGHLRPIDDFKIMPGWTKEIENEYLDEMTYWEDIEPLRSSASWKASESRYDQVRSGAEHKDEFDKKQSKDVKTFMKTYPVISFGKIKKEGI